MPHKDRPRGWASAGFSGTAPPQELPYVIELWSLPRTEVERVIARADTLTVAQAIFASAISENPSRQIILRRGDRVIRQVD